MRQFVITDGLKQTILSHFVRRMNNMHNNVRYSDYYQKILSLDNIFCFICGKEIKEGESCTSRPASRYCHIRWYHSNCREATYH